MENKLKARLADLRLTQVAAACKLGGLEGSWNQMGSSCASLMYPDLYQLPLQDLAFLSARNSRPENEVAFNVARSLWSKHAARSTPFALQCTDPAEDANNDDLVLLGAFASITLPLSMKRRNAFDKVANKEADLRHKAAKEGYYMVTHKATRGTFWNHFGAKKLFAEDIVGVVRGVEVLRSLCVSGAEGESFSHFGMALLTMLQAADIMSERQAAK